jgi:type IV pilus assembly protein PilW
MKNLSKRSYTPSSVRGFTLVELMVAVTISGVVMAGIYSAYYSQQKSYVVQEQVAAVQQNLRAAMYVMEREIRMSGCDPTKNAGAVISSPLETSIQFTEDISDGTLGGNPNGSIDPNPYGENITYSLTDGVLNRTTINADGTNNVQPLAENIEAIDFVYIGSNQNPLPQPIADPSVIRSVRIAIIAKSEKPDPQYTSSQTFKTLSNKSFGPYTDHFRREILNVQVKCRNIAIETAGLAAS